VIHLAYVGCSALFIEGQTVNTVGMVLLAA